MSVCVVYCVVCLCVCMYVGVGLHLCSCLVVCLCVWQNIIIVFMHCVSVIFLYDFLL